MIFNVNSAIWYTWAGLGIVWLAGMAFTKRSVRSQPEGARLFQIVLGLLGLSLLSGKWFQHGWLGIRFLPPADWVQIAGLALTVVGCLFAVWARVTLGGNWSGGATVKETHELMTTGPYSVTRHPIYTGIIVAVIGTALAGGEMRCIVAVVVIVLALMAKIGQEEKLMMQSFPDTYPQYRTRVKALIPGVL